MTSGFHKQVMTAFSERLKAARIAGGYAHAKDFAEALGVEPPTYRYWERGQAAPDLTTLTRICRLLKVEPNDLLPLGRRKRNESTSGSGADLDAA